MELLPRRKVYMCCARRKALLHGFCFQTCTFQREERLCLCKSQSAKLTQRKTYKINKIYKNTSRMSQTPKLQQNAHGDHKEKKRKESILDLSKYLEKNIRVKFAGGREAAGILKGYDPLLNLVLDNTVEYLRDPDDPYKLNQDTRSLGLVVCRGTSVVLICPVDGMESIPNPFVQQEG